MPRLVTAKELSTIMDLTDRRVNQLVTEGIIEKEIEGNFDVMKCIISYYKNKAGVEAGINYEVERALHEKIKRETAEIQLAELRGNMHNADDVKRVLTGMLITFKSKILAIPGAVAARLTNQSNPNVISTVLTKEVKTALQELSEYDANLFISRDSS
jgi:phage terminase Nu1 subunit (DNA packaging protein)